MPAAKYRLYRRSNGTYYQQDHETGAQVSLRTKEKHAAKEKLRAANESVAQPRLNLDLARVYLKAHDAEISKRTWKDVMSVYSERGRDTSRERCRRAFAGRDFDPIRRLLLINTRAEDLLRVLATGKASVNHYLRRLVHHAEGLNWLPWTVMAVATWPKVEKNPKRGITAEEHQRILDAEEKKPERWAYYQMLWLSGGSQGDIARLRSENVQAQVLAYQRGKLPEDAPPSCQRVGPTMQQLLNELSKSGSCFRRSLGWKRNNVPPSSVAAAVCCESKESHSTAIATLGQSVQRRQATLTGLRRWLSATPARRFMPGTTSGQQ